MIRKITLLACALFHFTSLQSQVVLYESFNAPFNPSASGWDVQNLSSPAGTNTAGWYQGNASQYFNAIVGSPNDYFAADRYSTSSTGATNTISCWLITPTLNLVNGAVLQFAIKTPSATTIKPERLQVYYSLGLGTNVGNTAGTATNTAGTFTNILRDINPNLSSSGFPVLWSSLITTTLSGITTPTVGRLAFRYYVPNGGPSGPNSNYIGLDEVRYQMPCSLPGFYGDIDPPTATVCVGAPTSLKIYSNGFFPVTSYTWFTGATTNTTVYTPTVSGLNEIWTLGANSAGCEYLDISFIQVKPSPTVNIASTPNGAICTGGTVALNASGASTYTWSGALSSTLNTVTFTAGTNAGVQNFSVYGVSQDGCKSPESVTSLTVSLCVGLERAENLAGLSVYPTPCRETLHVQGLQGRLTLYNLLGDLVLTSPDETSKTVSVSSLPAGIYLLFGRDASGKINTFRIIKE